MPRMGIPPRITDRQAPLPVEPGLLCAALPEEDNNCSGSNLGKGSRQNKKLRILETGFSPSLQREMTSGKGDANHAEIKTA